MDKTSIIGILKQFEVQQGLEWEGPTPLYHKLYSLLKDQIVDGTISHGAQLPTEHELGDAFGLSRITVKRAMDELAAEKLVERRRGRGTKVTYKYKPKPVKAPLTGVLESIENMGRHTTAKVIHIADRVPPADVREDLGLQEGDTACYLVRVRLTEDENLPFAYYVSWTLIDSEWFSEAALEKHTRFELLKNQGTLLSRIDQFISAEAASAEVAKELNLKESSPLLVVSRRSYDTDGKLVDIMQGSYNPGIFQYQMSMDIND